MRDTEEAATQQQQPPPPRAFSSVKNPPPATKALRSASPDSENDGATTGQQLVQPLLLVDDGPELHLDDFEERGSKSLSALLFIDENTREETQKRLGDGNMTMSLNVEEDDDGTPSGGVSATITNPRNDQSPRKREVEKEAVTPQQQTPGVVTIPRNVAKQSSRRVTIQELDEDVAAAAKLGAFTVTSSTPRKAVPSSSSSRRIRTSRRELMVEISMAGNQEKTAPRAYSVTSPARRNAKSASGRMTMRDMEEAVKQ